MRGVGFGRHDRRDLARGNLADALHNNRGWRGIGAHSELCRGRTDRGSQPVGGDADIACRGTVARRALLSDEPARHHACDMLWHRYLVPRPARCYVIDYAAGNSIRNIPGFDNLVSASCGIGDRSRCGSLGVRAVLRDGRGAAVARSRHGRSNATDDWFSGYVLTPPVTQGGW